MHELYEDLEELCETVSGEIEKANQKVRGANGTLSAGDVEYLDKLTHMMKSIKTTMAMMDSEGYSSRPYYDGSYASTGMNTMGGSYARGYSNGSYARGRRYAKRDSMGRYSSRGYSRDNGEMIESLRELMEDAPDDKTRQEFQRFITKMESM
jgi:hypothetical protein